MNKVLCFLKKPSNLRLRSRSVPAAGFSKITDKSKGDELQYFSRSDAKLLEELMKKLEA